MTQTTTRPAIANSVLRQITAVIYRLVALSFFAAGIYYWIRLIGVYDRPLWRFDLMPVGWRAAAATLAVLYPVAGLGLWLAGSWGGVLWVLVAAIEAAMVVVYPGVFGGEAWLAIAHGCGLGLMALLRIGAFVARRRAMAAPPVRKAEVPVS